MLLCKLLKTDGICWKFIILTPINRNISKRRFVKRTGGKGGRARRCDPTHLGSTVRSLPHAEADKGGVRDFDQDVVDAVHVDELDAPPLHVVRDALVPQSPVETAVPV